MVKVTKIELLNYPLEKIWNIVTSLENYQWREDIEKIEICSDKKSFIEYYKNNFKTFFKITKKVPMELYEFEMENDNMKGKWQGQFIEKENGIELIFTEEVTAKKFFMRPLIKPYLKKQQNTYFKNLKDELKNR